jgi:HEAT repeat protein
MAEQLEIAAALLEKVKTYDWGQSRLALTEVEDVIKKAYGNKDETAKIEKSLLSVLESPDATRAGKDFVCRQLSIIGTEKSIPALAKMLTDEEASDMARFALERIPAEAVNEALRQALSKTSGKTKVGIINSLGARSDSKAVAALDKLMYETEPMIAEAAISALGKIASAEATQSLATAKDKVSDKLKAVALDAYLKCADKLIAQGKKTQALAIYKELQKEGLPKPIRTAAVTGMVNAMKK